MQNKGTQRAAILFDGKCSFCINSIKLVKRLDWLHRFVFRDLNQRDEIARDYPASTQQECWKRCTSFCQMADSLWVTMHFVKLQKIFRWDGCSGRCSISPVCHISAFVFIDSLRVIAAVPGQYVGCI